MFLMLWRLSIASLNSSGELDILKRNKKKEKKKQAKKRI